MKTLAILSLFILIAGTVSAQQRPNRPANRQLKVTKTLNTTKPATSVAPEVKKATGTVRDATCGAYIEVKVNDRIERYFPVNLNATENIEGDVIEFDYVDDQTAFPENCDIKKSIRVNNVRSITLN